MYSLVVKAVKAAVLEVLTRSYGGAAWLRGAASLREEVRYGGADLCARSTNIELVFPM